MSFNWRRFAKFFKGVH